MVQEARKRKIFHSWIKRAFEVQGSDDSSTNKIRARYPTKIGLNEVSAAYKILSHEGAGFPHEETKTPCEGLGIMGWPQSSIKGKTQPKQFSSCEGELPQHNGETPGLTGAFNREVAHHPVNVFARFTQRAFSGNFAAGSIPAPGLISHTTMT